MPNYKKILVLSNACFSMTDSNGRTLAKLLQGFEPGQLAQFFVYGAPDYGVCSRYYQVSDRDALNSMVRWAAFGGPVDQVPAADEASAPRPTGKTIRRTPLSMLLREIAWRFGRWDSPRFREWVDDFSPDALFLFLGDNVFLPRLARKLAKERNILIYVYSTEEYAFKNYNYLTCRASPLYWLFYRWLNRGYRQLEPHVKLGIFNTPMLAEAYQERYSYPCEYLFGQSDIDWHPNTALIPEIKVSYLGNLGVGRHVPLIELADALADVVPGAKLELYGKMPEEPGAAEALQACPNICTRGFVSYEDVVRVIHESTLLVHAELDDPFYSRDLKYAFSTKIADSVCSGTPFLIYARPDLACTDFLLKSGCAFVATNRSELRTELRRALTDEGARLEIVSRAKAARDEYFTCPNALKQLLENG